jgi:hypothetical protein
MATSSNRPAADQSANEPAANESAIQRPGRVLRIAKARRPRRWRWIAAALLLIFIAGAIGVRYAISHAAPILRSRVISTLSARFKSKVDLAEIDVSLADGLTVHGSGLMIFGQTDANPSEPGFQPLLSVQEFRFQAGLLGLFHSPMRVHTVYVNDMVLNIPPKEDRSQFNDMRRSSQKMSIVIDELVCENTTLLINTHKPGKAPLGFLISHLKMKSVGRGQPMFFEATLVNPKPVGDIQSQGKFGPFREAEPRETPVVGDYSFTHADLGTLRGISGILSSTGKFGGTLGKIEVGGETDTPDFRLNRSGHAVGLHTDFHAIVDGTDGDTYLQPVKAKFLRSSFTASGKVIRVQNPAGHDIELNVDIDQARIEDLLDLGVKTEPPAINGPVAMRAQMSLPPGPEDVADRLKLNGSFTIHDAQFSNEKIQERINELSLRAQGKPKLAKEHEEDTNALSELDGTFQLSDGSFTFSQLHFSVPGVQSDVSGEYSLDGNTFDFHGKLKLDAKLSQMTTGWKSVLLKPVDPFFKKDGVGTEIPFKVTGTRSAPHFGLDFGHQENKTEENKAGQKTSAVTPSSN